MEADLDLGPEGQYQSWNVYDSFLERVTKPTTHTAIIKKMDLFRVRTSSMN